MFKTKETPIPTCAHVLVIGMTRLVKKTVRCDACGHIINNWKKPCACGCMIFTLTTK